MWVLIVSCNNFCYIWHFVQFIILNVLFIFYTNDAEVYIQITVTRVSRGLHSPPKPSSLRLKYAAASVLVWLHFNDYNEIWK